MLPGGAGDISVPFIHNSPDTKLHIRMYAIVPGTTNGADGDHWYGNDVFFSTTSGDVGRASSDATVNVVVGAA